MGGQSALDLPTAFSAASVRVIYQSAALCDTLEAGQLCAPRWNKQLGDERRVGGAQARNQKTQLMREEQNNPSDKCKKKLNHVKECCLR